MKKHLHYLFAVVFATVVFSCQKEETPAPQNPVSAARIDTNFPETFETGTKTSYTTADVVLATGSWNFNDALIGTLATDHKNGAKAARIENTGKLTMNFDVTNGASQVTVLHAKYSADASSTWQLYASTNSGSVWIAVGSAVTTASSTLSTATFTMNYTGNVRFRISKTGGGRLNIDDFTIYDNVTSTPTRDDNMGMGNPSNAVTNTNVPDNYLMVKTQYTLSYNNSKGEPNWVSWHLSTAWKGSTPRCDCFTPDNALPSSFYKATTYNYTNTGFDRGHLCPAEDRDGSSVDNEATFLMTNITPQAPNLNRVVWVALEDYCRTLMYAGNELYIIAGGYGSGGSGSNGGTTTTIASAHINVPSHFWKVIVVLTTGGSDASRVASTTRVIAVDMPNTQTVNAQSWGTYRVSVDALESITGYDFLTNVPVAVQGTVEAAVDNGPTQ